MGVAPYWSCELYSLNMFTFPQPQVALNGIWLQLAQWLLRRCLKLLYYESYGPKVKQWPWPLLLINISVLIKTTFITIFWPKHSKLSMKSNVLAFSHIWSCCKKGQYQPRVIKWTILVVLVYLMLHTMFQGNQSISSGEEDFYYFFSIYGQPCWSCDPTHLYKFSFPFSH